MAACHQQLHVNNHDMIEHICMHVILAGNFRSHIHMQRSRALPFHQPSEKNQGMHPTLFQHGRALNQRTLRASQPLLQGVLHIQGARELSKQPPKISQLASGDLEMLRPKVHSASWAPKTRTRHNSVRSWHAHQKASTARCPKLPTLQYVSGSSLHC